MSKRRTITKGDKQGAIKGEINAFNNKKQIKNAEKSERNSNKKERQQEYIRLK